jgi:hypothetical protein
MSADGEAMASFQNKADARETWRPGRAVDDELPRELEAEAKGEFESVPPSRHDQPSRRGSFRIPMLLVPRF